MSHYIFIRGRVRLSVCPSVRRSVSPYVCRYVPCHFRMRFGCILCHVSGLDLCHLHNNTINALGQFTWTSKCFLMVPWRVIVRFSIWYGSRFFECCCCSLMLRKIKVTQVKIINKCDITCDRHEMRQTWNAFWRRSRVIVLKNITLTQSQILYC